MTTVTNLCTLEYVAEMLGEDLEMLETIIWNDDNISYGAIVSVNTGDDEPITALTDDGIEELKDMLSDARVSQNTWHAFLEDFVGDPEIIKRVKGKWPR
jgi:hypothetical protein